MDKETKLKIAAEEIKEILRKHDLAAAISIHTPGLGHIFVHFNTSYSCAYVIDDKHLRIYSKSSDYPSKEEHQAKVLSTHDMFSKLRYGIDALHRALDCYTTSLDNVIINYNKKDD